MLAGKWRYIEATNNDSALFTLTDTDFIEFLSDSTFRYEISAIKKSSFGTWRYNKHTLHLKYKSPDTTRYYKVEILSKRDLIFTEGSKRFVFKRLD